MNKAILVGGFSEIVELCDECGIEVIGIIDNSLKRKFMNIPILGTDNEAKSLYSRFGDIPLIITPDNPNVREKLFQYYKELGYKFRQLISPKSNISKSVKIGEGTVIQALCNISANCHIGSFCKINTMTNVMHDCIIKDFSTLAPNAVLLGKVTCGKNVYVGANSTILPYKKISDHAIIGAGAVLTKDIRKRMVVVGVPAREL